jgi:hypothetical protein
MKNPVLSFHNTVILELKFTNRFPDWFRDLARMANVMQCGAAKYVESIQGLGHQRVKSEIPVVEEAPPTISKFQMKDLIPTWVQ